MTLRGNKKSEMALLGGKNKKKVMCRKSLRFSFAKSGPKDHRTALKNNN